jgi:single-strand DNA-binding protein
MRSINKVILIGNLTRNPEMRQTPNGQSVTTFGVATNREWSTREGDKKNSAEFHECVAWAKLAEICNDYLKKGQLVYIEGYLKTRSWDSPEGVKKFKTEIVVKDMIRLEKRSRDDAASDADYSPQEFNDEPTAPLEDMGNEEKAVTETPVAAPSEEPTAVAPAEETPAAEAPVEEENPIDKDLGL